VPGSRTALAHNLIFGLLCSVFSQEKSIPPLQSAQRRRAARESGQQSPSV